MMEKPAFKPYIRVEILEGEGVFLLSENGHKVLTGRLFELVAPFVDGNRSPDDIADCLGGKVSRAEVYYTLSILERKSCLIEADTLKPGAAHWPNNGVDACEAGRRLEELPISVKVVGDVDAGPFMSVLEKRGIRTAKEGMLKVVLTDDYLRAGIEEHNLQALAIKKPWMLVKPVGIETFIGPLFVPGETGCWKCLKERHILNREVERYIMEKKGRDDPVSLPHIQTPATIQVAYGMVAEEIARWIEAGGNWRIEGKMLSIENTAWQTRCHILTRLPHCPSCGKTRESRISPVVLKNGKAVFTRDGGYRAVTPEETFRRLGHLVSPVTGIVNFLEREPLSDGTLHVYVAGNNLALRTDNLSYLKRGLKSASFGKGASDAQAKASGICEAIERHSGLYQGYELRIKSSLAQLSGKAIHPNECMLFSQRQYSNRKEINSKNSRFNLVPEPFDDESLEMEWSPVWSLTNSKLKYLPTQYLYYRYVYPDGSKDPRYCSACSNGSASGNNLEEAVLQGFFELVERDSVAIWWYNMLKTAAVDLVSFDDPYFIELSNTYSRLNRDLWVLDVTSDLGIPAFAAVSRRADQEEEHILLGFGCHLDAGLAVKRALTEMNQCLASVLRLFAHTNDAISDFDGREVLNWWKTATCINQPYLNPDEKLPVKQFKDYPNLCSDDLLANILVCEKVVEEKGMEMLVLDQTRPDIGVSVAKVIVPGLRHFWPRFAPGRLYDVPVQMGWRQRPIEEEEINPIAFFL
jgi:oxazoline/thiazoline synthase